MSKNAIAPERIFSLVAKRVSPTLEEAREEKAFAEKIRARLQRAFSKRATLFFVGSTARDTGIRGDRDIDIFVAFPKGKKKEAIVKDTVATVKRTLPANWEMHYAEHPYLQGKMQGYKLEVVPCFKIEVNEGIISAVDRTPLHAQYLQKHLSEKQKRDVRVLKALLKAHGIYGAELEVAGFSGLVCEYLILNYRSLQNLLSASSSWAPPIVLDIEDYYDQEYSALEKRFETPLIIIDFIDRNRNAAAAISPRSFSKFIAISRAFLSAPSEKFFSLQSPSYPAKALENEIARRNLIIIKTRRPGGLITDIMVPQLRRSESALAKQLQMRDFRVFNSGSFYDEQNCYILLEIENPSAYPLVKIKGPPLHLALDVRNFIKAHKKIERGPLIEGDRVVIEEKRQVLSALDALRKMLGAPKRVGIASHFVSGIKASTLLTGDSLLYELRKNNSLREKLAQFLLASDIIG
ncbi:MAG: CCA tRNA nucleotidyltransferase [Candidatus Micrarchaeota archaeon]